MPSEPDVTIDAEKAPELRDWLRSATGPAGGSSTAPSGPVAVVLDEVAAALDGQLGGDPDRLSITVGSTATAPGDAGVDHADPHVNGVRPPAAGAEDLLPSEHAFGADPEPFDERIPGDVGTGKGTPDNAHEAATDGPADRVGIQPPDRGSVTGQCHPYAADYECSVCGDRRHLATTHEVSAFVDDCPACGTAAVKFVAVSVPERGNGDASQSRPR